MGLGEWIVARPSRLAHDGRWTDGQVVSIDHHNGAWDTTYVYDVEGVRYEARANLEDRVEPGTIVPVVYLPDVPRTSFPRRAPDAADLDALRLPFRGLAGLVALVSGVFGGVFAVSQYRALQGRPVDPATAAGWAIAALLTAAVVISVIPADSGAVIDVAFGLARFGVPTMPLRVVGALALCVPMIVASRDGMVVMLARPAHVSGRFGMLVWLLGNGAVREGLGAHVWRVRIVFIGYVALFVAWLAWTAHLGI